MKPMMNNWSLKILDKESVVLGLLILCLSWEDSNMIEFPSICDIIVH